MKTFLFFILSAVSVTCFSQASNVATSTGCACKPEQTTCSASSLFMSCCTCCTPPASCGSWSAFGLCGCKCELVASAVTSSEVKFFPNKYKEFMDYLTQNNIDALKFKQYASTATLNKNIVKGVTSLQDYIILDGIDLASFIDTYLADMKELSKNTKYASILDAYLNKK